MMTLRSNALGRAGEDAAVAYLEAAGYTVIARNWRLPPRGGELDIVARHGAWLVFVEVRSRRASTDGAGPIAGTPEESVTPAKQARLAKLAAAYLYQHPWAGPARIDVIALELAADGAVARLNHLRDAVGGVA
jgi:putative endonuclease